MSLFIFELHDILRHIFSDTILNVSIQKWVNKTSCRIRTMLIVYVCHSGAGYREK